MLLLLVSIEEHDSRDFCVLDGVAICIKMLCGGKAQQVLLNDAILLTLQNRYYSNQQFTSNEKV